LIVGATSGLAFSGSTFCPQNAYNVFFLTDLHSRDGEFLLRGKDLLIKI